VARIIKMLRTHRCADELPTMLVRDGDIVKCSCGKYWRFSRVGQWEYRYSEVNRKAALRLYLEHRAGRSI